MSNTIAEKLQQAFGCFNARDLAGTERLCAEILRAVPQHPHALHLLGVVHMVGGKPREAASFIDRALRVTPQDAAMQENLGMARAALGDYRAAEAAFRQALALGAAHAQLHMRLGMALAAQGRIPEAETALRSAAARAPDEPEVQLNLGGVLAGVGRAEEALACFQKVAALRPQHPDAYYNLGTLYSSMGRNEDALAAFRRVVALDPMNADAHNNLGLVHGALGQTDEAVACFRKAIAIYPDGAHAHSNLGNALRVQGRLDEAAAACERALAIQADLVDALINLGNVRAEQFRLGDAQSLFERALRLDSRSLEACRNLGKLFMDQGRMEEAIASYRRALEFDRDPVLAHVTLGMAYLHAGSLDPANACFRKALELRPDHVKASFSLAETLKFQGRLDEATTWYERVLDREPHHVPAMGGLIHTQQHMCSWHGLEQRWQRLQEEMSVASDGWLSPFAVLSLPSTPAQQRACAEAWARRNVDPAAAARPTLGFDFSKRRARDRLRIGYLGWGLHGHATGHWAVELFELHDRARCEVFTYSYGPDDGSAIRARIRGASEHFIAMSQDSHLAAARRIYDDGVDVLVDLTGYSLGMRPQILALRPAPVQVNWFYAGTMGTRCMDYFIADPYVAPPELDRDFTERIMRLPDCYMITDRKRPISDPGPSRAECGLPEAAMVFCCFNQTYKILPDVFASWMRILQAVPGSVLWLLETNRWAAENLPRKAAEHGVAAERIVFAPLKPMADHLARYRLADLALDTFPYTSHTTAADALWAGCPLVTRMGSTFASRVAGSALINAGMRELVTDNPADFERLSIELATNPVRLREIRRRIREGRDSCALFDTPRFVRNLENAYEEMFRAFGEGNR